MRSLTQTVNYTFSQTQTQDLFELSVIAKKTKAEIIMSIFCDDVTTKDMKYVLTLLEMHLPTILESQCFNDSNLPFAHEVLHTEIGHLFEHILLEYLCIKKIDAGHKEAIFSGTTKWNWEKEKYGTFHIFVDVPQNEKEYLSIALEESIQLLKKILSYHMETTSLQLPFTPFPQHESMTTHSIHEKKQMA